MGVKRELNVTAALDLELLDYLDRGVVEHLPVSVGKCHNGSYDKRVTRVNTDGIDVFHSADGDRVVKRVAHYLKLYLLISLNALLNKHLVNGRELERVKTDLVKLLFVVGKASSRTAERERRTEHDGISDPLCRRLRLFN